MKVTFRVLRLSDLRPGVIVHMQDGRRARILDAPAGQPRRAEPLNDDGEVCGEAFDLYAIHVDRIERVA